MRELIERHITTIAQANIWIRELSPPQNTEVIFYNTFVKDCDLVEAITTYRDNVLKVEPPK